MYSKAKVVLLDDVLSALDVHTARWIVDHCFTGDLVEGRTIILVVGGIRLSISEFGAKLDFYRRTM